MRVFKCLDHDEIVGLRICMSKFKDLSNMLFCRPFYAHLMYGKKVFKIHDFLFLVTWNNVDQVQRSGSFIRIT